MRVGAVWGVHGNRKERRGHELGRRLETVAATDDRLSVMCANERAVQGGQRCIQENMAVSLKYADPNSPIYERQQAAKVLDWCREGRFDLLLDIHSGPYDHLYCGVSPRTTNVAMKVARLLGYNDFIVDEFGIYGQMDNALLLEVPNNLDEGIDPTVEWQRRITELLDYDNLDHLSEDFTPSGMPARVWAFQNALRIPEGADPDELLESNIADGGFVPIGSDDANSLGIWPLDGRTAQLHYAINVGSVFLDSGILGEYLRYLGGTDSYGWRDQALSVETSEMDWATLNAAEPVLAMN